MSLRLVQNCRCEAAITGKPWIRSDTCPISVWGIAHDEQVGAVASLLGSQPGGGECTAQFGNRGLTNRIAVSSRDGLDGGCVMTKRRVKA